MTHDAFIAACRTGTIKVHIERAQAARFVSARMLLPFVLLPLFSAALVLSLAGQLVAGIALFVATITLRQLVRASSRSFVLRRALEHASFYDDAIAAGVLKIEAAPAAEAIRGES